MRRLRNRTANWRTGILVCAVFVVPAVFGCGISDATQTEKSKPVVPELPADFTPVNVEVPLPHLPVAKKPNILPAPQPRPKPTKGKEEPFDPDRPMIPVEQAGALVALEAVGAEIKLDFRDRVVNIDMKGTELSDETAVHLAALVDVRILNLSETNITDKGVKHLASMKNLRSLFLYGVNITDAGLVHLAGLVRLEKLCLDETRVSDEGTRHLKGLIDLESLHLRSRLPISDTSLPVLEGLKNLTELKIVGTKVTAKGLERLKKALPDCRID